MLSLITAPNVADTLTSIGAWSAPIFTDLLVVAVIIIGILVGFMAISKVTGTFVRGAGKLLGGRKGGRRRR